MVLPIPALPRAALAALSAILLAGLTMAPVVARPEPGAPGAAPQVAALTVNHPVISEVMTGGASASDEFIELYNPAAGDLSLEGLELIYASASGTTVTRKATWDSGAPPLPPGGHLLLANAAGLFAADADATYSNGLAAGGGSVALRLADTLAPVDAVGWGTATSWLEGAAAPAPPAGSSLERLPGGVDGSGQDTDDNAVDFAVNPAPDPQSMASEPIPQASATPSPTQDATPTPSLTPSPIPSATPSPSATASPSQTPSPTPTASQTPEASPTPSPAVVPIGEARALPDGAEARIAGTALMDSGFADGGGCVVDDSGGIAVLPDGAIFARGDRVDAMGTIDDRYAQRTLRVASSALAIVGSALEPAAVEVPTGEIGEALECRPVRVSGSILGAPTELSSGLAFDLDDGSGAARVLVASRTGIDTSGWKSGSLVALVGVVGQRDSSGTGSAGYRIQPRDPADVESIEGTPTPTPSETASPTVTPDPSESPPVDLLTIAQARSVAPGALVRVRGVVTLPNGLVDEPTAVIQDASGAIVLRLGDGAGAVGRGTLVEVTGTRSTKSGMETIRTDRPPLVLGSQVEPAPEGGTSGGLGEASEARLVVVRGAVTTAVTRSTAGNVAFTLDDGSGPLRVTLFAAADFPAAAVERDTWVEVIAVLGQETTGALPTRGYRLWPRGSADLRVIAAPTGGVSPASGEPSATGPRSTPPVRQDADTRALDVPIPRTEVVVVGQTAASAPTAALADAGTTHPAAVELASARSGPGRLGLGLLTLLGVTLALCLLLACAARVGTLGRARDALGALVAPASAGSEQP